MENSIIEIAYPLTFREEDSKTLGEHLRHRHSVELIGMKRVGISNFLRFFLYKKGVAEKFIDAKESHFFITVDLNDLIEREVPSFWVLTFKRVLDAVERFKLSEQIRQEISRLFLASIQSQDHFLTIENLRRALSLIVEDNKIPTIFFLRFDRIKDAVSPIFFDNLLGLKEATNQKLSYVFTSYRSLDQLVPQAIDRKGLSVFSDIMYIKPTNRQDARTILTTFEQRYHTALDPKTADAVLDLSGGHTQYMHLLMLHLTQTNGSSSHSADELSVSALTDERITLQSDEIYESLSADEQEVLIKVSREQSATSEEKVSAKYIWNTGIVTENAKTHLFSPLFTTYLMQQTTTKSAKDDNVDFSKKENGLYTLLLENINQVCERDKIIQAVWPEYEEFGVSDWTIDRLVARLRSKLKKQHSSYEIVTIKTRGYKLVGIK